ncbi:YdcH family protein [Thermosulfurimonas sp. F29]|uniref:YdcH family protein n=1 Tax=Thermosulfurimonas sp. F29 TaxID=2867247 RepID=UPI001C834B2B|nr:YdcH family protein [Thermosulfurimonas sp. F29]MBX6423574.1 YdcH family protein [Thermosulfurimonas sp. F29]
MDKELVKRYAERNPEIRELFERHQALEKELSELVRKAYLTAEEEVRKKRIQKEKLALKDRIYELIKREGG